MASELEIDAYFERIGYTGERTPTLETLKAIHLQHAESIPFENLNPLLRWPVRLDLPSLQQKLVHDKRGGYCYEHNLLLKNVLQALGFRVIGLAARVLWTMPEGTVTPLTHMLLRVEADEDSYIADVGFGGMTLSGPLRLVPEIEQATPHEPFRLLSAGDEFVLQAKIRGEWRSLYRFGLREQLLPDYEMSNWYVSNHPDSHFVNGLIAARPAQGRRYALRNNELVVHYLNGETKRRSLSNAAELRAALEGDIQLRLPDAPELEAMLERVATMRSFQQRA